MAKKRDPAVPTPDQMLKIQRYRLYERIIDGFRIPAIVAATYLPLQPAMSIAHDLAGRDTRLTSTISLSIAWGAVASAGWAQSAARARSRKKRLESSRLRTDSLEQTLFTEQEELDE